LRPPRPPQSTYVFLFHDYLPRHQEWLKFLKKINAETPPELEIHGDRGTAATFDNRGDLAFWCSSPDRPSSLPERWRLYTAHYREQAALGPSQATAEPHAEQIRDFVTAVREGRPPLVDGAEARKALVIVEALYRSARTGQWVELNRSGETRNAEDLS